MAQLGVDLSDFDLWPLTLTFCILSLVITPENFMMIWWWEHSQKGVTEGLTDRQTDGLNSNWSYSPETANLGQIRKFLALCDLKILQITLKNNRAPFYATSSFVHHFVAIGEFKLELQSGNIQSGSNSTIFLAVWPRNFTDDSEKQYGTSFMLLQALCNISYPLVNSNWSNSPETPTLGQIRRFF